MFLPTPATPLGSPAALRGLPNGGRDVVGRQPGTGRAPRTLGILHFGPPKSTPVWVQKRSLKLLYCAQACTMARLFSPRLMGNRV
eukprot:6194244-Pleurochrysis_carterae.AAC.1